jgi:large subunit ribosomal protein L28
MAKSEITGKRRMKGNHVSHSNIKTKRWQNVNVQERRLWVPELGKFIRLNITTRDLRTIDKKGLLAYAKEYGVDVAKL